MDEQLLRDIEEFLHTPKPIGMVLIATCDRYSISRAGDYLIIEDNEGVIDRLPIIGDLGGTQC
jgi:hypothetical protein